MKSRIDHDNLLRREFLRLSAIGAGGLGLSSVLNRLAGAEDKPAKSGRPLDAAYLEKGLNALARAHNMSSMAGHLGASFIAGFFIGQQRPHLDPEVYRGIEGDLDRVLQGGSVFGKRMSKKSKLADPELFESFPKQKPDESLVDHLAEELGWSIDKPRQSGHNVIFASLSIRALREHPEFATPAVVEGIRKLLAMFNNQTPGSGYYGKEKGRMYGNKIVLPEEDGTPEYNTVQGMAVAVFDEAINLNPEVHRSGYGGLVHIINHAAAITDLAEYGYDDLLPKAIRSHRQHLRLWRNLPDVADERGPLQQSRFTPHSADYWTSGNIPYDRALLTHRVKTMYGFDELAASVEEDAKEKSAYEKLRYLM